MKLKDLLNEKKDNTFGLSKSDYDAALQAADRKRIRIGNDKIREAQKMFPKMNPAEAEAFLKIYHSPVRNTFTRVDIMTYAKKHYK